MAEVLPDGSNAGGAPLLGVFVGGRALRMGGRQKALLRAPGPRAESLLARLRRVAGDAGLDLVLVGESDLGADGLGLVQLADRGPCVGPLAGMTALLAHAQRQGIAAVIAVASDMPYVDAALLQRLCVEAPGAVVLAPRDRASGKWHPLCARYSVPAMAPALAAAIARGARSFQAVFRELSVVELALSAQELPRLRDWDTPEDMR